MGIFGFLANSKRGKDQRNLFVFVSVVVTVASLFFSPFSQASPESLSDTNSDSITDWADLAVLASHWLDSDCNIYPGWCGYADMDRDGTVNLTDYVLLATNWQHRSLSLRDSIESPVRLAYGPGEKLYVTDTKHDSLFIYDPNMILRSQLKLLEGPLGVAVDDSGNMYVGSKFIKSVEVFDPNGIKINDIGSGLIKMPNDLEIGPDGNLYVCDSKSDLIRVYDPNGTALSTIGQGQLQFPSSLEIATVETEPNVFTTELYVADQGHQQVVVFDLQGTFLRSFGSLAYKSMMGSLRWQGRFVNIQSLEMDDAGFLHVLDSAMRKVQIVDPNTPAGVHTEIADYIDSYGVEGGGPGQLGLPQDISIRSDGRVYVTDIFNHRVELLYTIPLNY
jgi:DNA-binding beta-propeller fold protein YncE